MFNFVLEQDKVSARTKGKLENLIKISSLCYKLKILSELLVFNLTSCQVCQREKTDKSRSCRQLNIN